MRTATSKCPKCQKTIAANSRASLTSWLFRQVECRCELEELEQIALLPSSEPKTRQLSVPDNLVGKILDDRYEVVAHIGSGGMGSVYQALDRKTGIKCALKVMAPDLLDQKLLAKRLEHEAKAAKALSHPNIVPVFDNSNESSKTPYLVMGLVDGKGLDEILQVEKTLSTERAIDIFIQIADALVHAHEKGIIHRDIKPSNILLGNEGNNLDLVKIVDFGIAKIVDENNVSKTNLTQTGELIGSPLFMSPEQCRGEQLDARSDIYSFGCVMYQALSGRPPFDGENPVRVLLKHISEKPEMQIRTDRAGTALRSIILRCLEKEPSERYQNASFLLKDLERIRDGKRLFSIRPFVNKRRLRTVIPVIAALALCVPVGEYLLRLNQNQKLASQVKPRPEQFEGRNLIDLNAAIEKSPSDATLYFARGKLHELRDERKNGIADFTKALELNPKYAKAFIERSFLSMMMADYPKALSDAKAALQLEPNSPYAHCQLGAVYLSSEQFSKAMEQYEAANKLKASHNSYSGLGRALFMLAEYDEAEKAFSKAREFKPKNLTAFISLATAIYRQDLEQANIFFDSLIAEQGKRPFDWGFIAYYHIWRGNLDEAQKAIEQMKSSETFPARGYRIAGDLYRIAGHPEKAVEELSASTSLEEYPPGYRERALAYINLGQLRSAEEDLEHALKLNPNSTITLSLLALVESKLGHNQKANALVGRAFVDGNIQPPIVYANRARVELMQGLKQAALQDANQAIKRDPWLKDGYEVRADVEKSLGDLEASGRDQTKAKALFSHLDTV
jgi:serine/threonine protein kinase/uncharacterized protein HemY